MLTRKTHPWLRNFRIKEAKRLLQHYLPNSDFPARQLFNDPVDLGLLRDAVQTVETTSERFFESELYRLRGELLLMLGNKDGAEGEFWRASEIARQQQARSWELRAAISMARLWRDEGKQDEAHDLLASIYSGSPRASTRTI